jgi:hypothetical protein
LESEAFRNLSLSLPIQHSGSCVISVLLRSRLAITYSFSHSVSFCFFRVSLSCFRRDLTLKVTIVIFFSESEIRVIVPLELPTRVLSLSLGGRFSRVPSSALEIRLESLVFPRTFACTEGVEAGGTEACWLISARCSWK